MDFRRAPKSLSLHFGKITLQIQPAQKQPGGIEFIDEDGGGSGVRFREAAREPPEYRFVSSTKEVRDLDFAERFVDRRKAGRKLVARVRFRFREYIPTGFDTCRSHGRLPEQGRA